MVEQLLGLLHGGILQPLPFTATGMGARITTLVDILIVAALLTVLFRFLRRSRATNILWSFLLVGVGIVIARVLNLATTNLLLTVFFALLVFALPILFQPELRRGLERLGRRSPFRGNGGMINEPVLHALTETVEALQTRRHGALMVLERRTELSEYADTGVPLHADVQAPLLEAIFTPASPLHDGAVIIRGGSIIAAACMLPLASEGTPGRLGTRHRAALGVSETSDAIAVTVSEERGVISVAADGRLLAVPSPHDLGKFLRKVLHRT
jgi:diadenylate cyclase